MFEQVSQAAEKLASNMSRRAFVGRIGQGALAVAGVLAATLAFPGLARAGDHPHVCSCGGSCSPPVKGCILLAACVSDTRPPGPAIYCEWDCSHIKGGGNGLPSYTVCA